MKLSVIFVLPHPDKTRVEDQPFKLVMAEDDWIALTQIAPVRPAEAQHVVVPVFDAHAELLEFPSEES